LRLAFRFVFSLFLSKKNPKIHFFFYFENPFFAISFFSIFGTELFFQRIFSLV